MTHTQARLVTLLQRVALLALVAFTLTGGAAHAITVQRLTFPVTLSNAQTYTVVGYLYYEESYAGKPLQVLMHGGTYSHEYWDFPKFGGEEYSYAKYMSQEGYAVLALDMLGSGESSRPDGDFLDLRTSADAVHQVVVQLRTGQNALGASWSTVIGVGHSLGSATGIYAQAAYSDFNALVTTGLGHVPHAIPLREDLHARAMAAPYFSLPPDERTEMFHYLPLANPLAVTYDNAIFTNPISRGMYTTAMVLGFDPLASRVGEVQGPVLVQLGDNDRLFPAAYASGEASWWTMATVTVQTVPNVGHSFNMHAGRLESWELIDAWVRATLFPGGMPVNPRWPQH